MRTFRSRPVDIGKERARTLRHRIGSELRGARIGIGLTQAAVGRRADLSQAEVSKAERAARVSLESLCRIGAAVGHEVTVRLHPVASVPLRDRGQLALAQSIVAEVGLPWRARLEVPVGPNDLRAADLLLEQPGEFVVLEVVRSLVDLQAQMRSGHVKRTTLAATLEQPVPVRFVIAVPDSARARQTVGSLEPLLAATFPVASAAIWAALRSGSPTGGDGILFVRERDLGANRRPRDAGRNVTGSTSRTTEAGSHPDLVRQKGDAAKRPGSNRVQDRG